MAYDTFDLSSSASGKNLPPHIKTMPFSNSEIERLLTVSVAVWQINNNQHTSDHTVLTIT